MKKKDYNIKTKKILLKPLPKTHSSFNSPTKVKIVRNANFQPKNKP